MDFLTVIETILALTIWWREAQKDPLLTEREVTQRLAEITTLLPSYVELFYDECSDAYAIVPLPRTESKDTP